MDRASDYGSEGCRFKSCRARQLDKVTMTMLNHITVAPELFEKFPDYSVALLEVRGVQGGPSNDYSKKLLQHAEHVTQQFLATTSLDEVAEVKTWRAAFESFGVKPRVARSSCEALMRRADKGLPRIDLLTDIYNAVSVIHRIPIGGENLDAYVGPARLALATGTESFDTRENGETVVQHPEPGEVVWRDDMGVTCRRWNWRQCVRTRLDEHTTSILFILDGLGPNSVAAASSTADQLSAELLTCWPDAQISSRVISA
jgi:DNA/RNA-binding domain of Phe-tRNA-synthetase-like protein